MKYEWLNRQENKNLIVFFSGWATDTKAVLRLDIQDFDVLVFYDYRSFEPINFDFSKYEKKYLITWSMGVFVCNYYYEQFKNFDKFIAINGTQKPIDDNFGIPKTIYNMTIDNFNEMSSAKFMNKMSPSFDTNEFCPRSVEELRDELISIKNLNSEQLLTFDKAIVSMKDKIIPVKNQLNWWQNQNVQIEQLENAPHYIFNLYKSWSDLI